MAQGDIPDGMYMLASGSARALVVHEGKEITLARLQAGDWFGETALLDRTTRTATVRASEPVSALWLDRVVFDTLLELHPEIRGAFGNQARVEMLHRFLRTHAAFEDLSLEAAAAMYPKLRPLEVPAETVLVREGEPGGTMYLVEHGRLEATTGTGDTQKTIGFIRTGDIFGERSLVTGEPCVATVRAVTEARLLALDREAFQDFAGRFPAFARRVNEQAAGRNYLEEARVPLDFAKEILPGAISEVPKAGPPEPEMPAPSAQGKRKSRRPKRFPVIRQVDESDCGVACLAMIAAWHGIEVPLSWLREVAGTDRSGTTLRALAVTGRRIGLDVEPVKLSRDRLDLQLPAILHWDAEHWVVLVHIDERHAEIADPGLGLQRMDRSELERHWDGYAARVTPTGTTPEVPAGQPHLQWLVPFLLKHRRVLIGAMVLALVAAACEVALPLVVEHVVNAVIARKSTSAIEILGLAMLGLAVGGTIAVLFQRLVLVRASARFDTDTLDFVTTRLLGLPMSYFATRRIGDIERRLSGVREIRRIVIEQGVEALSAATQVIVGMVIMFVISPLLALLFLVTAPVYALAMRYASTRLRPLYAGVEHSFGRYASDQIDLLKGIETVKSTGTETALRNRLQRAFADLTGRTVDSYRTIAAYGSAVQLISLVLYGVFVTVGALQVKSGGLSVGGFVAFTVLVLMVTGPLVTLLNIWDDVQVSTVLLNRIADVLDHEPEQGSDKSELLAVPTLEGRVQLQEVVLSAAGSQRAHPGRYQPGRRSRHDGGDRRTLGIGEVDAIAPPCRADRAHVRDDPLRPHRLQAAALRRSPPAGRLRPPGAVCLRGDDRGQHLARRRPAGHRRRPLGGGGRRLGRARPATPPRLRHARRRPWPASVRGSGAAPGDRPGPLPQAAGAALRRSDERARHRVRVCREAQHRPALGGPYGLRRRPPSEHDSRRRPHRRARARSSRRAGEPRRAPGPQRGLLLPLHPAALDNVTLH